MAEVISFQDGVRSVRRRRAQDVSRRSTEIIELNLRLALELYHLAPAEERAVRVGQVRALAELLEYAVNLE